MAKKSKKAGKKDKGAPDPAVVVDAVRERGRGLLDEVTSAAQRIRESFDDLRVLEDVRALRAEVDALARRLAAVEQKPGAAKPAAAKRTPAKSTAARSTAAKSTAAKSSAAKSTAAKSSARKPASAKPAAKPRTTTRTRSSSAASASSGSAAGRRPAAAKRSTGARKPSGS